MTDLHNFLHAPQLVFDEEWYTHRYQDVRRAIEAGQITDALHHYITYGRGEGRAPNQEASKYRRVVAYGSYGSNNVGDEAILEGLKRQFPNCMQIYHNKVRSGSGILATEILSDTEFFGKDDLLVVGGGGLLYDEPTVSLILSLAEKASVAGARVEIRGLGCESAQETYYPAIAKLFGLAAYATVRSSASQRIIKEITCVGYEARPDLAFNLSYECSRIPRRTTSDFTIGIVTASSDYRDIGDIRMFAKLVKRFIHEGTAIRFIHIPHSRSYFNIDNNDCVSGELLWTLLEMHHAKQRELYTNSPYNDEPLACLSTYGRLDAVMSSRYHGLVFGHLMRLPTMVVGANLPKLKSFAEDWGIFGRLVLLEDLCDIETRFLDLMHLVREARAANKSEHEPGESV